MMLLFCRTAIFKLCGNSLNGTVWEMHVSCMMSHPVALLMLSSRKVHLETVVVTTKAIQPVLIHTHSLQLLPKYW